MPFGRHHLMACLAALATLLVVVPASVADSGTNTKTKSIICSGCVTATVTVNWQSKSCSPSSYNPYYHMYSWSAYFERSYAYRGDSIKFSTVSGQIAGYDCGGAPDSGHKDTHSNVTVGWADLLRSKTYTYSTPTTWPWMSDVPSAHATENAQLAVKVTDGGTVTRGCVTSAFGNYVDPGICSVSPT